jgi:arylsulfatase A-like enzyme/GH35 family endo-1,4-beta-xylanase
MKQLIFSFLLLLFSLQIIAQEKTNILFILVDDLKPTIKAYGDDFAITPNMDKLAEKGFVFQRAYTQQAVCAPSRASMLTGLRPDRTKVWDLKTQIRAKNPDIITLPQWFKQNGYITYGTGKVFDPRSVDKGHDRRSWTIPYLNPFRLKWTQPKPALGDYQSKEHKLQVSFYEKLALGKGLKGKKKNSYVRENYKPSTEQADVPDDAYVDGVIANNALEKLDVFAKQNKPFMLMVGFKRPHLPFAAPTKYWNLYNKKKIPVAKYQKHAKNDTPLAYHNNNELKSYTDIPPAFNQYGELAYEKQKELIHGYYAATSYVDAQIGKLLKKLKETGLDKNTIIVLWGDHGWHLGDHGLWAKHTNFEQATRLPLLFYVPGMEPGETYTPVESVGIIKTLCDLTGLKPAKGVQGESLVPFLKGEKPKKAYAVSQWPTPHNMKGFAYTIRTKRYRYTEWYKNYRSTQKRNPENLINTELFDYETDPLETKNFAKNKKYAEIVKEHQKLLHDFLNSQVLKEEPISYFLDGEARGKPEGTPVRKLVAENFKEGTVFIGATIDWRSIGAPKSTLLAEQFSYTTPENAAKQHAVHPEPGIWDWAKIDKIINFSRKNNIAVRLHGPVSPQASSWAKDDKRTKDELLQNMTEYMTEQCKHFQGKSDVVKWMDVVNETVGKGAKWFGPKPGTDQWENPWLAIGLNKDGIPVYIEKAFEIATKYADPNIKLIYNQHLNMEPEVWEKVKSTVLYLRKKGCRVDGIGWQAHLKNDNNVGLNKKDLEYLANLIDWAHANNLEFHVTEIDYKIKGTYDIAAAQKQAIAYANILKILLSKRGSGVVGYNTWGLKDGFGRYDNKHRFIFDEQLRAKPAFYAIQKVLENTDDLKPVFDIPNASDNSAKFDGGLLKNGSFEDVGTAWMNWGTSEWGYGTAHTGNMSAVIGPKSGFKQKVKGLKKNTDYILSFWIKTDEGDKVFVKVQTPKTKEPVAKNSFSSPRFTKTEIKFNSGSSTEAVIIFQKWTTDEKTSWVDDVVLTGKN